jgi:uncharacterized SAM-binding protein YcdF (DUF218 family)
MRPVSFLLKLIGLATVVCVVGGAILLGLAGYWLTSDDDPEKADAVVVLAGDFSRPLYAADLYHEGYAPLIYFSNPPVRRQTLLLRRAGIPMPRHAEIFRRMLIQKGVPGQAIRIYGENVISTAEEAEALARVLGDAPVKLLLVTSPYHVRRAKLTFERALPNAEVLALGTAYEDFPRKWWTDRDAAIDVVLEFAKFMHYLIGGRFRYSERPQQNDTELDTAPGG